MENYWFLKKTKTILHPNRNKVKKGLEILRVEKISEDTVRSKDPSLPFIDELKNKLSNVEFKLQNAQGRNKRRLKKMHSRLSANIRKETLVSKLKH